jgi:hypothetical protein
LLRCKIYNAGVVTHDRGVGSSIRENWRGDLMDSSSIVGSVFLVCQQGDQMSL